MDNSLQPKSLINSEHYGKSIDLNLPLGKNDADISVGIHYFDEGSGEPLVLVHSAGQSVYTWNKIFYELSGKFRVIALDLAGHGYSDALQFSDYSIATHAQILDAFLRKLNISSAHFVAFSLGCAIVAKFAQEHPTKIGRIIMLSPGGITPQMPTLIRMLESPFFGALAALFINRSSISGLLHECFLDQTKIDNTMIDQYALPLEYSDIRRGVRLTAAAFDEDEFIQSLATIKAPVHILTAAFDKWRTLESTATYFKAFGERDNCTTAEIKNAGHLLHEEQPTKIINAINTFIAPIIHSDADDAEDE